MQFLRDTQMNKYKCFNLKCSNTTPRHDTVICNKCSCHMDVVCIKCNESVTSDNTALRTTDGQLCSDCCDKERIINNTRILLSK